MQPHGAPSAVKKTLSALRPRATPQVELPGRGVICYCCHHNAELTTWKRPRAYVFTTTQGVATASLVPLFTRTLTARLAVAESAAAMVYVVVRYRCCLCRAGLQQMCVGLQRGWDC